VGGDQPVERDPDVARVEEQRGESRGAVQQVEDREAFTGR